MAGCCWPWKITPAKQVPMSIFISLNLPLFAVGNFTLHRSCVCVQNLLCATQELLPKNMKHVPTNLH